MATVSPANYLAEILDVLRRHGAELFFALASAAVAAAAVAAGSSLPLLFILPPAIGAALLFEVSAAAWRIFRRQRIALATTRSLLDLNAGDREDLEQHLLTRYRNRERRLEEGHATRIAGLTDDIVALQAGLSRADDDGWPVIAPAAEREIR
jgi:hypothetical protein